MPKTEVHERLLRHYAHYYEDGPSEWRQLGAIDKVANILALCEHLPQERILEIGAGDGSIMSRLSELGSGDELYAVEVSASGVEVVRSRIIPLLVDHALFDGEHVPPESRRFDGRI